VKAILTEGEGIWRAFLAVPHQSMMTETPEVVGAWHLNLFRISGQEPYRDYLAWRPTFTKHPDFHVPSAM
jgi:hypothetical protein